MIAVFIKLKVLVKAENPFALELCDGSRIFVPNIELIF